MRWKGRGEERGKGSGERLISPYHVTTPFHHVISPPHHTESPYHITIAPYHIIPPYHITSHLTSTPHHHHLTITPHHHPSPLTCCAGRGPQWRSHPERERHVHRPPLVEVRPCRDLLHQSPVHPPGELGPIPLHGVDVEGVTWVERENSVRAVRNVLGHPRGGREHMAGEICCLYFENVFFIIIYSQMIDDLFVVG